MSETPKQYPSKINPQELNALFSDIDKYNKQFNAFSILGKCMSDVVRKPINEKVDTEAQLIDNQKMNQQITSGSFIDKHASIMNSMGLRAESVSNNKAVVYVPNNEISNSEMRLNIGDREKFVNVLRSLSKEEVSEMPDWNSNLQKLVDILEQQLKDHYNLKQPSDDALNLLASMKDIVHEYERIGLNEEVKSLATLLKKAQGGYLKEHLLVQNSDIMQTEGFGPAQWHLDSTRQGYQERWNRTINVLDTVKANVNSQHLAKEIHSHLQTSIQKALKDMSDLTESGYFETHINKPSDFTEILEEMRSKLDTYDFTPSQIR